ncbi:hypothetical protein Ndes2526B_g00218 [Nannochloris sp. 'desiccata']|nr:hypothetical protein KSW81_003027 [Chlorella desiccata (nom. nud.)]KAH7624851.1 hypothetical protein NADE_002073 [Chlorella desiccata (nom. nud.)]
MAEDIARLERAQERLLEAMDHTAAVLTNIESGNASQAQEFSSKFVEAIEESQTLLLEVANKQQAIIPYALDTSVARLEAAAAECENSLKLRQI